MFDFFRDMARDIRHGSQIAETGNKTKEKKYIFSKGMKTLVVVLGILYLLMAMPTIIAVAKKIGDDVTKIANVITYGILIVTDLVAIISLLFGKKKGEKIALVAVIIFILLIYGSSYIFLH